MNRARFVRRALGIAAPASLLTLVLLSSPNSESQAHAAPPLDGGVPEPSTYDFMGSLKLESMPLLGRTVDVSSSVRLYKDGHAVSGGLTTAVWSIASKPVGSTATLSGTGTSRRSLTLDRAGSYQVRLTVCPSNCTFGTGIDAYELGPQVFNLTITAQTEISTPPDVQPDVPNMSARATSPRTFGFPYEIAMCGNVVGGIVSPQWITADYFANANSYKLVEGTVHSSHIAQNDNPLNHSSQDWNIHLKPDAPYRNLLNADTNKDSIEVEWERDSYPEPFRPHEGDRISVFGYHILDCGHLQGGIHARTEIHPPVLSAVHRPRVIQLPADAKLDLDRDGVAGETVGSNAWVSGVVSDVWVNANGGDITYAPTVGGVHVCQPTSLGQPNDLGPCIHGPSPLNRTFTFNVYLPKSPQKVAQELGMTNPKAAPLYYAVQRNPSYVGGSAPQPKIVPVDEGGLTYLRVTYDLTGYSGTSFGQQIVAGWVYPSADNWGVEQWRLAIPSVRVHDDAEWEFPFDDGDWRLWVGTHSTKKSWFKLFDCDGCVESSTTYTPSSSTWVSGATGADGLLAGDVMLRPGDWIPLAATAWEDDPVWDTGGVGSLATLLPRIDGRTGSTRSEKGTGKYTVNWKTIRVGASNASLTAAGTALKNDYRFSVAGSAVPPSLTTVMSKAAVIEEEDDDDEVRAPDALAILGGVSLATVTTTISKSTPAQIDTMLRSLRAKIDVRIAKSAKAKSSVVAGLVKLSEAYPTAAWNARFGDLAPKP